MEFSSLVLMEKEKDTGLILKEIGSYEVGDGAKYITRFFYDGESIKVYFDTHEDVEEWKFTAIYDLFDEKAFEEAGFKIDVYDEEYNPTWIVTFEYSEEYEEVSSRIQELCNIIEDSMAKVMMDAEEKKREYI